LLNNNLKFLLIVLLIFSDCSTEKHHKVSRGVYYWKTAFNVSRDERQWLKNNNIGKIYLHFFDVDWDPLLKEPVPAGAVTIISKNVSDVEIIPVVFITNKTLLNTPDSSIKILAGKIFKRINDESFTLNNPGIKEIQMDCDWTLTTKSKYFNLLNDIKALCRNADISLSATIRLHQVKYFKKTGVPPVDRGVLMFYNMTSVSNINTVNSIFNQDIAKKYLINFNKYPIKLDLILPAFSWGVLFHNYKISGLINDLKIGTLKNNKYFIQKSETLFKANGDIILNHHSIRKNDLIRVEEISPETTQLAARLIEPYLKSDSLVVSLFYLNKEVVKNYDKQKMEDITDIFN
jgi:hypothetical protein